MKKTMTLERKKQLEELKKTIKAVYNKIKLYMWVLIVQQNNRNKELTNI